MALPLYSHYGIITSSSNFRLHSTLVHKMIILVQKLYCLLVHGFQANFLSSFDQIDFKYLVSSTHVLP